VSPTDEHQTLQECKFEKKAFENVCPASEHTILLVFKFDFDVPFIHLQYETNTATAKTN
jgi:hypothetical protein